jgi:hypothetical protein
MSSIDGIVCSLCGFATCMVLELMYVIWLCVAVAVDATREVRACRTLGGP